MASSFTDDQWRGIFELATAAIKYPKEDRRAFLEGAGSSPEMIEQVLILTKHFEEPATATDRIGTKVGHFIVTGYLGQGGMGDVYTGRDVELERKVALKFVKPDAVGLEGAEERFMREARTASALNHPNIVTIFEII